MRMSEEQIEAAAKDYCATLYSLDTRETNSDYMQTVADFKAGYRKALADSEAWVDVNSSIKPESGQEILMLHVEETDSWEVVSLTKTEKTEKRVRSIYKHVTVERYCSDDDFLDRVTHWCAVPSYPPKQAEAAKS